MTRASRFVVGVFFLLSGACALGYEVVWAKFLTLTLGGNAAAQAAVLAAFLGGLAAGGFLLGPSADEAERPLRLFALLELGIALCGFVAPWVLPLPGGILLVTLAAVLMGGTLPALARGVHSEGGLERTVSRLYTVNNAGAALGALLSGFVLIPWLGLIGTSHLFAGVGLLVAVGAYYFDRDFGPEPGVAPEPEAESADRVPAWLVLAAVLVSGVVTLCYEAAWVRMMAVVLGASTYSFTAMLTGFVAGMGLGSLAVATGRLPRWPSARLFGLAQLGAGLAVLAFWPVYERLPWLFYRMSALIAKTQSGYYFFEAGKLGFCFLLTLLPTAFLGAAFPLASRTAAARLGMIGTGVGAVGAVAALGNVVGAMTAGLYLLPALGVQGLLTAGAAVNITLGALIVGADGSWPRRRRAAVAAFGAAAFGVHLLWGGSWDRLLLAVGTHRFQGVFDLSFHEYLDALRLRRAVLFQQDDAEASVSVMEMPAEKLRALMINGKADASNGVDMSTQRLLGQLPFVLRPEAKTALLVGLGSGVTAGTSLLWPIERLDVVEISPAVVAASAFFNGNSGAPLRDPRLRLHVGDGRAVLRKAKGTWDAIVSEPSNPWIAGVGNLFTVEYFRLARSRLAPGGVMVQWFHVYETDDEAVKSVLRSFSEAFDDVSIWRTNGADAFVVGFNGRTEPDFAAMDRRLSGPPAELLKKGGLPGLGALLSLQTVGDPSTRESTKDGRLNQDLRPFLEYAAPRGRYLRSIAELLESVEDGFGPRREELLLRRYLAWKKRRLSDEEYAAVLTYNSGRRDAWRLALAKEWAKARPGAEAPRVWLARIEFENGRPGEALTALGDMAHPSVEALLVAADAWRATGDDAGARRAAVAAAKRLKGTRAADMWMKAAQWSMDDGKGGEAADALGEALKADPDHEKAKSLFDFLMKSYGKEPG
ncbi:MAG: hypothetical protein HYZ75_13375 [Elusimicrobia bacterium]|nr:hypothetical protein [Elusimicrobiota bacterium]